MALRLLRRSRPPNSGTPTGESPAANSKRLRRRGFIHNVIALYGVQACTYALPLLTFPYLARVLGPSGWGVVVFAQAIGDGDRQRGGVRLRYLCIAGDFAAAR